MTTRLEDNPRSPAVDELVGDFITRWRDTGGSERANYQLFLTELCQLLGLPQPDPASGDTEENAYVFERRVDIANPDGSVNRGFIDLYRRGCFVLEAKQTGKTLDTRGWDKAMLAAHTQADQYVRALPSAEGRPPFIVVTDVGRSLELYSEFTRSGGTYVPFPDPTHHRIRLDDLRKPAIRERLRQVWLEPDELDPGRHAARVTRTISDQLARLARSLEVEGYEVERVAHFLKRCLFTMFSEDVELLPKGGFTTLLERLKAHPEHFGPAMRSLWETMNTGGYEGQLMETLQRFNGGLFRDIDPIPLNRDQIQLLIEAARADWRFVEPAIFGTLLERALDPRERHKLGAHYTPRAYVERLVMPTLIEPLRREWNTVQVAAEAWLQQDKPDKALNELREFHYRLCQTRVLDPACGSGNFLYVALEHLKRLEGEVLNLIRDLSAGQQAFDAGGLTVDPHQFLGLELNPRAAAIAEMVLWIGYLQWDYRLYGRLNLPEPILRDFKNIENRDALIDYDNREPMLDDNGEPVTIWDGISYRESPVTGELIPDEQQRIPVYRYSNPRKAEWPEADYIVGNPPFIGDKAMRRALGDGYVDALREVFKGTIAESADFVTYWWHIAAEKVRNREAKRFGFITTNSLRQTFNRRVLESHLSDKAKPLSLVFAIPDHPWVDSTDGAAVRIAMTVGAAGNESGILRHLVREEDGGEESRIVRLNRRSGKIFSDLTVGANVAGAGPLESNNGITTVGVQLSGMGFVVSPDEAKKLGLGTTPGVEAVIRDYRNGRDLSQSPRGVKVIDLFGLDVQQVREKYPAVYQWVLERVKPERDQNKRETYRKNWWIFAEPRKEWRNMSEGLTRYIATVRTAKHRIFPFLETAILPDAKIVGVASDDAVVLGTLSSRPHLAWALAAGANLGAGNDPTYNHSRCFETFPFPELTEAQAARVRNLAEQLDAHRKRQQAEHPKLTLTGMYNVLEKLRAGETLTAKEKTIHQQGLVTLLRELHDELDRAVFEAYGWDDLADVLVGRPGATTPLPDKPAEQAGAEEELLTRLVALNSERAAEEARGHIRWLRPDYQAPEAQGEQTTAELKSETAKAAEPAPAAQGKKPWPKTIPEQVETVRALLAVGPQSAEALAAQFKRKPLKGITQVLAALEVLGQARRKGDDWQSTGSF
ncbi:class I SAM-dependent DNA methyltransferase [Thiohalomonas denitrificans]|uniref:site-specific DNA-methyltransferase (adenine-specific) n=1 Tax=Thiohalomonas denitrificans TaxID=415747 RepID=A0A1G5R2M6_9GAMM|nr:DNA methyltransferase [Thiohalomonas denitrificans]SCZ68354.1 Type II restriction/modification system, DNA methylase subunit YeeA [Thiohalomonas denitrificans]